ncbi:hypothetical protein PAXRUDRAFT_18067 [Paxillus rubicundulus Ve08.2h10]|uniref:Uncharacterized protein n=1 Tax=Paxillus rubicundulus Ve08.2h10 TaxID=930991 RepID=A0A0D0DFQ5_9AGAM|nr:hypothetical protein PAXRUDRAFT_18067 [Paxillus rubicundulus Ve08.2h10]
MALHRHNEDGPRHNRKRRGRVIVSSFSIDGETNEKVETLQTHFHPSIVSSL